MARTKQVSPAYREPFNNGPLDQKLMSNGHDKSFEPPTTNADILAATLPPKQAGFTELVICVGGIYASLYELRTSFSSITVTNNPTLFSSSLSWALLQERITTTPYGPASSPEIFTYSIFLNTIQSVLAALVGYAYLRFSSRGAPSTPPIFPSRRILAPLLLVAVTSSLASPFGYASLKHVGYITFVLAKSCKLVPVMALHVGVFRKKYPAHKYAVVALVTAGVALFTLHHPTSAAKSSAAAAKQTANSSWGLLLLAVNLLFDGITNATQDHINTAFRPFSGAQMMCANNILSTALTATYLAAQPWLSQLVLVPVLGGGAHNTGSELALALAFVRRHPAVVADLLAFAACGAVGQLFIFATLARFSSLLLVTITVTRKMLTMLLSVVWFGHALTPGQWLGVGLVFGGVGAEAGVGRWERGRRERERAKVKKL